MRCVRADPFADGTDVDGLRSASVGAIPTDIFLQFPVCLRPGPKNCTGNPEGQLRDKSATKKKERKWSRAWDPVPSTHFRNLCSSLRTTPKGALKSYVRASTPRFMRGNNESNDGRYLVQSTGIWRGLGPPKTPFWHRGHFTQIELFADCSVSVSPSPFVRRPIGRCSVGKISNVQWAAALVTTSNLGKD